METTIINSSEINSENNFNMSPKFHLDKLKKEIDKIMSEIPRVENMKSSNGNDIPNQFIIRGDNWTLFQSYNSPIVLLKNGKTYIFSNWAYSVTTGKYRNVFLSETKEETLSKLRRGEYIAVDFKVN